MRIRSPWSRPIQVEWSARYPVTWVMAKTKTRSKNSSSGVTRCSDSGGRSLVSVIGRSIPEVDQRNAGAAERLVQLGAVPDVVREDALDDRAAEMDPVRTEVGATNLLVEHLQVPSVQAALDD